MNLAKFCPKCGTERQAKFCAKCGFAFASMEETKVSTEAIMTSISEPEQPVAVKVPIKAIKFGKLDRKGEVAGWYPDPLNSERFRRWDGATWSDEISDADPEVKTVTPRKQRVLLEGLVYGEDYDASICCYNCGNGVAEAELCALCGQAA